METSGLSSHITLKHFALGMLIALAACSSDHGLTLRLNNISEASAPTLDLIDVHWRIQPHNAPRSVNWRANPPSDQWWTAKAFEHDITIAPGQSLTLQIVTPPTGRWQRVWFDVQSVTTTPSGEAVEDHSEPTAVDLYWPEDEAMIMEVNLLALPSPTTPSSWALFTASARVIEGP